MAALPTGVTTRGRTFHLRVGIPQDLQHLFPKTKSGKTATDAFRGSLGTTDRAEASRKAYAIIADWQSRFEQMRREAAPVAQPLPSGLTDHLIALASQRVLEYDDGSRLYLSEIVKPPKFFSDTEGSYEKRELVVKHAEIAEHAAWEIGMDLAAGTPTAAENFAKAECKALGIVIDWQSPLTKLGLIRIQRALGIGWQKAAARSRGELIETPQRPIFKPESSQSFASAGDKPETQTSSGKTLLDVIPMWVDKTSAKPPAVKAMHRAVNYYIEATGSQALASLSKASGGQFERFLLDEKARGFRSKTASNYAASINALVNIAVRNDLIDRNPLALDIDAGRDAERREPWTDEQLAAMTASDLFSGDLTSFPSWREVSPSDARAALLLVMHTGARIGEIAQLRTRDFQTKNTFRTIRITGEAGTVKTTSSERTIPLAQHLLDDPWFSQWITALTPDGVAFPSLQGRDATKPGDVLGRWFRRFRESLKLPSGGLEGSHKFRHWIRTKLSEANVSDATADSITGHSATGSAGRTTYTAQASLATMKDALDRLRYPDISGLKK